MAQPRAAIWRVVCGLVTTFLIIILAMIGLTLGAAIVWPDMRLESAADLQSTRGVFFALASFIAWWPGLAIALMIWHRRSLLSLLNERRRLFFAAYFQGFGIAVGVSALTVVIGAAIVGAPVPAPVGDGWAMLAGAAVLLLIIQTGAEELMFRGYLQQQLGARFRSGLWWAVIPSVIFGALHWTPESFGSGAIVVVLTTGMFGMIMAVIVARTGDLSLVMGLHLGANVVALLAVAPENHLSGMALFHWPDQQATTTVLAWVDFLVLIILGLAILFWDQRRRDLAYLPEVFK